MSAGVATPSRSVVHGRRVRTFLDRHASLMPTLAALVIFVVLLVLGLVVGRKLSK